MAIRFTAGAPDNPESQLSDWFPQFSRAGSMALREDLLDLSDGYEVRYLNADRLKSGDLADAVEVRRWRFLVSSGGETLGEIEFDDTPKAIAFYEGAAKDGFRTACDHVERLPGDYEASVLLAPALRFVGLWLRGSGDDRIMPYPPNATPLSNFELIPIQEAADALREIARALPYLDNRSDEGGG